MIDATLFIGYGMVIPSECGEKLYDALVQTEEDEDEVSRFLFPINAVSGKPRKYFFGLIGEEFPSHYTAFYMRPEEIEFKEGLECSYFTKIFLPRAKEIIEWKPETFIVNRIF